MAICSVDGCDDFSRTKGLCNKHAIRLRTKGTTGDTPRSHAPLVDRFWRRVEKGDGCWLWLGSKTKRGYGRLQIGGKGSPYEGAHRYSFTLKRGPIPLGMVVMHTCDNPSCVNPEHLKLGTYQDNMDDMWAKGRGKPGVVLGEKHAKSKLTEENVRYIRAHPERGHKEIADELGLSPNAIRGVRIGRTWRHIP